MFRGGFARLDAVQNMSGERQWKREEIESISEYWGEMSRRSSAKRESLDSLTTREVSLTRSCRNLSALVNEKFRRSIETGRLYNKASRTPSAFFGE